MAASDFPPDGAARVLSALFSWISPSAVLTGPAPAQSFAARGLLCRVEEAAAILLRAFPAGGVIGLLADNSPAWLVVDLATHVTGQRLVPLPAFFTPAQQRHAVASCAMDGLVCETGAQALVLGFGREMGCIGPLRLFARTDCGQGEVRRNHGKAQKVTYTSGTTGAPKGIALSRALQMQTAEALAQCLAPLRIERHLSLLPFPVLLENVAGAYTALRLGATCICPPLQAVGMSGAVGFDADRCLQAIRAHRPHSLILLPQMLKSLVDRLECSASAADVASLKFVAVGGARTPATLILRARALGLPVYEGYGLSECGSVVSLNVPGQDRIGSAGKPIPGVSIRPSPAGELEVLRSGFPPDGDAGSEPACACIATGDLGEVDDEGFVHVRGRSSNVLVTAFGRNVSPEWPEELLLRDASLAQAVVFGDARPYLVALLVAGADDVPQWALRDAVNAANAALPDYARIHGWIWVAEPFTPANGLATENGRMRRDAIWARYGAALETLYEVRPRAKQRQPHPI